MDPVTVFGVLFLLTAGLAKATEPTAQVRRKKKLGLQGAVTLKKVTLALNKESCARMQKAGALDDLLKMIAHGEFISGGAQ